VEVNYQAVGKIYARNRCKPHFVLLVLGALCKFLKVLGIFIYHVEQAKKTEVTATSEISSGVFSLKTDVRPSFIDHGGPILIFIIYHFLIIECFGV